MNQILIGIPTLNEAENVGPLVDEIKKLDLNAELFFVDDSSTDGTPSLLKKICSENKTIKVMNRKAGLGIGTAHLEIIRHAYKKGYKKLITMDCDFSHQPRDIPKLLVASQQCGVVVGSRFLLRESLEEWSWIRKLLTHLGHELTKRFLGLPMDATGAFRCYDLSRVPEKVWDTVFSTGYAFFFESLVALKKYKIPILEVPITLPKRVYGHSKLNLKQAWRSFRTLCRLSLDPANCEGALNTRDSWNQYWQAKSSKDRGWYAASASLYRKIFIRKRLFALLKKHFAKGSKLLHIGCGSGEVDTLFAGYFKTTGADISLQALELYKQNVVGAEILCHDILSEPTKQQFDGTYSLGLLEHFATDEIIKIFKNIHACTKPGGKAVIFWPHKWAPSVLFLKLISVIRRFLGAREALHPAEPSLLAEKQFAEKVIAQSGWELEEYLFGPSDLWIQVALVLRKKQFIG